MGNKLRHEGDEVRIKVIWPDALVPPGVFEMSRIVCAKVAAKTAAVHSWLDH
jgi:hypothetical protein